MSSKEILTSFMDMLGFTEFSYAMEFIAENNFSESQIRALTREFDNNPLETTNNIDIDSLFEDNNIIEDLDDVEEF